MLPGLVVPGPVPGWVGVTPPLAAAALPAPAVPGPPVVVWAKAQLACATIIPDAAAMLRIDFMAAPILVCLNQPEWETEVPSAAPPLSDACDALVEAERSAGRADQERDCSGALLNHRFRGAKFLRRSRSVIAVWNSALSQRR